MCLKFATEQLFFSKWMMFTKSIETKNMVSNVDFVYVYVLALMAYLSANYYVMYLLFLFGCESKNR